MKFTAPDITPAAPRNFSISNVHNNNRLRLGAKKKQRCWQSIVDGIVARLTHDHENENTHNTNKPLGTLGSHHSLNKPFSMRDKELKIQGPRVKVNGKCIQKFVLDWKVDNVEFLLSYCRESIVNWNQFSSPVTIMSETFTAGKEIERESVWGLTLKSHYNHNGSYYFSLYLDLHDIVNLRKNEASLEVSFVLHALSENERIFSSKQGQNILFKLKPKATDTENAHHGFNDFLSFMDVNNPENKLIVNNSLHFRLEIYIPSKVQLTEIACPAKSFQQQQHGHGLSPRTRTRASSLKKFTIENYMGHHFLQRGDRIEVVACNRSFYIGAEYLERYPKLKALCEEDKANGNCGIISIPCYSDDTVNVMLSFIVGDWTDYVTKMDEALEILRISQEFELSALIYEAWLNILLLLRLEHLPYITVLTRLQKAPDFVNNYVCVLLFMFVNELRQLKVYHYWLSKEPSAFLSAFLPDKLSADGDITKDSLSPQDSITFTEKYFAQEASGLSRLRAETDDQSPGGSTTVISRGSGDGHRYGHGSSEKFMSAGGENKILVLDDVLLEDAMKDSGHDNVCQCHMCRQNHIFCQERLLIDYLAKVKLAQLSKPKRSSFYRGSMGSS